MLKYLKVKEFWAWLGIALLLISQSRMVATGSNTVQPSFSSDALEDVTGDWVELSPNSFPPGRMHFDMVYDTIVDKAILYGGNIDGLIGDDTWAYDYNTNAWTELNHPNSPIGLNYHAMAYDSTNQKTILFGGQPSGSIPINETWAYDYQLNNWTQLFPATAPSLRRDHKMIYDPVHDKTLLFGGNALASSGKGLSVSNEIWSFDYPSTTWTKLNPEISPSARHTVGLAYDTTNNQVLLHAGNVEYHYDVLNETWVFDYSTSTWTEMMPSNPPSPLRADSDLVYHQELDKFIMFGGTNSEGNLDDTWIYDYSENAWDQLVTKSSPEGRGADGTMIYDSKSQQIILYGGGGGDTGRFSDTWALNLTSNIISSTISTSSSSGDTTNIQASNDTDTLFPISFVFITLVLVVTRRRNRYFSDV